MSHSNQDQSLNLPYTINVANIRGQHAFWERQSAHQTGSLCIIDRLKARKQLQEGFNLSKATSGFSFQLIA